MDESPPERLLDKGKIEKLVVLLRSMASTNADVLGKIRTEADYFERNAERMRYPKFRRQHLFVGSGVIEAGCKTGIGSRLKKSGMFWTVRGANAIIALRCSHLSGRFENYWSHAARPNFPLPCRTPDQQSIDFLGSPHIGVGQVSEATLLYDGIRRNRLETKLQELKQRMHEPIPKVGKWMSRVLTGYYQYHALPGNWASNAFGNGSDGPERHTVKRRSQTEPDDGGVTRLFEGCVLKPKLVHPHPDVRFDVKYPRLEPYALVAHVREVQGNLHPYRDQNMCQIRTNSEDIAPPSRISRIRPMGCPVVACNYRFNFQQLTQNFKLHPTWQRGGLTIDVDDLAGLRKWEAGLNGFLVERDCSEELSVIAGLWISKAYL